MVFLVGLALECIQVDGALRYRDNTPYLIDYPINSRTSVTFPVTAAAITITGDISNVRPDEEP